MVDHDKNIENYEKFISSLICYFESLAQELSTEEYKWASHQMFRIINKDPCQGLVITIEIINKCNNRKMLTAIAAGPLEILLSKYGKHIIKKIRVFAESNEQIQLALSGVFLAEGNDVYLDWLQLMKEYGFLGKNPREPLMVIDNK